ncbi:efflux RND transporter periplasmic adaptor subunit [Paludibaculum fermentans]|uniref:Efflux RND transporter periplasmic adaptor subunit n=1 Tax=Paludibaculum fermentans TaxID=1473598 RepID=A0A7S7NU87_PALFE|nr:efflux RND transporter periplasmic adaptor subunit [Paludibaculum fermentans]QOY89816.1 efflux RND transporter periplasmic adaptor subunit [Paludibaculum fermentans]
MQRKQTACGPGAGLYLILGTALLALAGCSAKSATAVASAPAAPVRVAAAIVQSMPVELRTIGSVEAFITITVKSQVGGVLNKVHFTEGDAVRTGQLLFQIDTRPFEQAVRQAEASLARDQALLKQTEATLAKDQAQHKYYEAQAKRYEELAKEGVFSKEQADQTRTEASARMEAVRADQATLESIGATLRADQATLDRAKLDLAYCSIRSPIDGRTGSILVKQGNLVKATDVELVTIRQIQPVYVTFSIAEKNVSNLRSKMGAGQLLVKVAEQGSKETPVEGALAFIENTVDEATGTLKLKAKFANSAAKFWPGQILDVTLRLSEKPNSVVVPSKSLQTGQSGDFVYVMKADNTVEMRTVKVGARSGDLVAVESGVEAGEQVVTEGQLRLTSGSKVRLLS